MLPDDFSPNTNTVAPHKEPAGPVVGIIIIIIVMLLGALYFWGALLNKTSAENQVPLITGSTTEPQ